MGRYLVLRIEDTKVSKKLAMKLSDTKSIRVVGEFVIPTKWCEGNCDYGDLDPYSIQSHKWGTRHCPICKLPKRNISQSPRNLLEDIELPITMSDMSLTVKGDFTNQPEKVYGKEAIARSIASIRENRVKIQRWRRRKGGR